jgi:hypothetical protein
MRRDKARAKETTIDVKERGSLAFCGRATGSLHTYRYFLAAGPVIILRATDLEGLITSLKKAPPLEQIRPNDGAGNIISKLINTVTTLFVGEKIRLRCQPGFSPAAQGPTFVHEQDDQSRRAVTTGDLPLR